MLFKNIAEFFYDRSLLPFTKENYANYITLTGMWLTRLSMMCFFAFFAIFFITDGLAHWLRYCAISLSVLASLSDLLDGNVARKYNCTSDFGKIFDPHCDKVQHQCKTISLLLDAFVFYVVTGEYVFLIFSAILKYLTSERDESINFHRTWAAMVSDKPEIGVRTSGKTRTAVCFAGVPVLHVLIFPLHSPMIFSLVSIILYSIIIWSLYDYVRCYRDKIKKSKKIGAD